MINRYLSLFFLACFLFLPEYVDAFSRTWYQKANIGGDARHRCTGFAIGNKGYIGGGHVNSGAVVTYEDYWEYDPATNSWTQIADYGGGPRYHSSAFTIDGAAYVGCGENGSHSYTNDFWKYIPEVNMWVAAADLPGTPRRGGVAFSIDGIGYFGTGQSDEGYHTDFYKYDPESDTWESVTDFPGEPRSAAVSFAYAGKGYVGTGHKVGEALNDFYEYDPVADVWTTKANVGGAIRQDAMAFCIDGKGYIGLGNDDLGNDFKDIWEYDFGTDTWTQIEDFAGQKRRYAVTFNIGDIVYLGSGTDGTNLKDFWAYAPTLSIIEKELSAISVNVYPNPSTNYLTIESNIPLEISSKITYSITDANGRIIKKNNPFEGSLTLNKSVFGSGLYFIQFYFENEIFASEKFIFK